MHSNTVALDSFPPTLLTFSDHLLLFLFVLSTKFSVPCDFHSVTLKLPFCLLPNWGEKSLTCQIPEGEGGSACLHLPVSTAEPEHHMVQDCFSLDVRSALVGLKTQVG